MTWGRVVICTLFLRGASAFEGLDEIESRLQELLAYPGYKDAFYLLLDRAYLNLASPAPSVQAEAPARVQAVLAAYADRSVRLQFITAAGRVRWMTAQTYGDRIIINTDWVRKASDDDLHAVLAHELAHDRNDCIRFWLIEKAALTDVEKDRARSEIEIRTDAKALELLRREKRQPSVLANMLRRYLPPGTASEARIRAVTGQTRQAARR